jgi:transposase
MLNGILWILRTGASWRDLLTHLAGTRAASARCSIGLPSCGVVAKPRSPGMPARRQRLRSLVHSCGRELAIQQGLAQRTGIGQKHADLAIDHLPSRATVLAGALPKKSELRVKLLGLEY